MPSDSQPGTPGDSAGPQPGPAALRYLGACMDTRKAWYSTAMLTRARPDQIGHVRQELSSGDVQRMAHVLCDMSGPMHPGDAARARDPMTSNGAALARAVLHAVLEAVLATPALQAGSPSDTQGLDQTRQIACLEHLKQQIVFWIDHGRLQEDELNRRFPQPAQIARFLLDQNPKLDSLEQALLRLACVAMTAPALEAAWVIARLSSSFLAVQAASFGAAEAAGSNAARKPNMAGSSMHRDEQDDLDDQAALESLNPRGV